ncbi:uncharacterized protein LOC143279472 [Babylonia areolata]|uniref:uncharacterized protein LOC143279472 n=1 Tax=Babylonia areolata TaxID=304850 RepID=UPI003FD2DB86
MFHGKLVSVLLCLTAVLVVLDTVKASWSHDTTTMAANASDFNETDCLCDCEDLEPLLNTSLKAPTTMEEATEAASKLVTELELDRSNLSATTRKKNSAPDHRPSAQGLGVVGVLVIVFVIGSIVALDFTVLAGDLKYAFRRLCGHPHQGGPPYRCRAHRSRNRRGMRRGPTTTRNFYRSFPAREDALRVHRGAVGGGGGGGGGEMNLAVSTGLQARRVSSQAASDAQRSRRREFLQMHDVAVDGGGEGNWASVMQAEVSS